MNKFIWTLKQLLPLKYTSIYKTNGKRYKSIWYQWFGKVFLHKKAEL